MLESGGRSDFSAMDNCNLLGDFDFVPDVRNLVIELRTVIEQSEGL